MTSSAAEHEGVEVPFQKVTEDSYLDNTTRSSSTCNADASPDHQRELERVRDQSPRSSPSLTDSSHSHSNSSCSTCRNGSDAGNDKSRSKNEQHTGAGKCDEDLRDPNTPMKKDKDSPTGTTTDTDNSLFSPVRSSLANTFKSARLEIVMESVPCTISGNGSVSLSAQSHGAPVQKYQHQHQLKRPRDEIEAVQKGAENINGHDDDEDDDDAMSLVESDKGDDVVGDEDEEVVNEKQMEIEKGGENDRDNDMMSVDSFDFGGSDDSDSDDGKDENDPTSTTITPTISKRFDADLVVQSIQRGESTLEQIKNRDCVLIVGKTGTGKSTLIQAMAGKKMQARQLEYSDEGSKSRDNMCTLLRKKIVYEAIDPLPDFEIGHEKKSKTTSIGCYDYDPNAQHASSSSSVSSSSKIMFVDSPGFEDTSGPEADVATSILLSQTAKHCRSLRFIIMISYVSLIDDRGGSMRSVLKLIRSFAKDFDKEKQSFMFLFTHCNEIQGVPDTIDGARECLYEEIIQILNGTDDEDTKEVLQHIRRSLKREHPFVNVYLPLQTNIHNLIQTVQAYLKPSKDPHIASYCGLTQTSRLTLSGELQHRLQEIRRDMSGIGGDPPMSNICAGLELFQYFHQYVNVQDIRDAVQEAHHLLETFVREQIDVLKQGMEKGTGPNHDFGPADINGMNGAFIRLQVLQEKYPTLVNCQDMEVKMNERMNEFHESLKIGMGESFSGMHRNLLKLQVWSSTFPQYLEVYEGIKNHLISLIQKSVDQCKVLNSHANFLKLSHDELSGYIQMLAVLHSIYQDEEYLSSHGIDTKRASDVYHSAVKGLESNIKSLKKKTCKILKNPQLDAEMMTNVGNLSRTIEYLNGLLVQSPICPKLKKTVENFRQQLSDSVSECLETIIAEIHFDGSDQSEMIKGVLNQTKLALEVFTCISEELFHQIPILHNEVVDKTKSLLMKRMGEIQQVTQDVKRQGIQDGSGNARMLHGLKSVRWFDFFLPNDGKIVENSCIAFERVFQDRIDKIWSDAQNHLDQIADETHDSELPAKTLRLLLPELSQVTRFAIEMKCEGTKIEKEVRNGLLKIVKSFIEKYECCVKEWKKLFFKKDTDRSKTRVDAVADKLERVLRERNTFIGLDSECDSHLDPLYAHVEGVMLKVSDHLKNTMEKSKKYKKKFRLLQVTHDMAKFSHVAQYLPRLKDLQVAARNAIASDAEKIQNLVSQTSEWDEIDSLLVQFQEATILDEFTWNEATSRIAPLLKLREQKQEEVDNLLDQMISDEDFKGIGDFLLPYAQSKDQVKNQRFNKWLHKISSILNGIIGSVRRNLEGDMSPTKSEKLVKDLQKLGQAEEQLSRYLLSTPGGLNLKKESGDLKWEINDRFQSILSEFKAAIDNLDFEAMGVKNHFIQAYLLVIDAKIIQRQKISKMKSLQGGYKKLVGDILIVMRKYIHSGFKDCKTLSRMLLTLKNASECTSPQLNYLRERYEHTRKRLTNDLNGAVASINEHLSKTKCYDDVIDVMSSLNQHLKCDLKDHIDDTQLSFNSTELLREWRDEKQKTDREMEFDRSNAEEKLHQWKTIMDRLDPSGNVIMRNLQQFVSGTTYRQKVREIGRIISERSTSGNKALKDGNHSLLDECIKILDLIHKHLGKHISHAGGCSKKMQQSAKERFLGICDRAQVVLQSENHIQFEALFVDYRGLILYVPCVMEDVECQKAFSLINQLIHDALDSDVKKVKKMLGDFAFDSLCKEIERARKFGNFVADHCTLLKEEISRCSHIETNDKWLEKVFSICHEHYSGGRVFGSIKDFAILQIPPIADKSAIKKSFKRLAKKYHPDKSKSTETSALFLSVTEARDRLMEINMSDGDSELPFGALIKVIGVSLRKAVREYLDEQRYDRIERILFVLKDLKSLRTLVSPRLNYNEIIDDIHQLVGSHVRQAKTTVESNWSSRDYKGLNDTITDLRMMEDKFKSYENIFPSSWDDGIVRSVEKEIETLGCRARQYLSSKKSADQNLDDFRRCFLNMGHVLVELPLFKDFTKAIMSSVLEVCLQYDWGYSFLFEFGLGLQRGDDNGNEEDNNVAQILVAEFSHFKEVMTMVWNEETSQKPAEDTIHGIEAKRRVNGIESELNLDKIQLLESYKKFEAEYKKLLGEYIIPDADLSALVYKTITLAKKLYPLDLDQGWNENVKSQIPCILSGVFAVFTVLKSGASYNRLESTSGDASDKLLMKPHNIQVLTLLSLFGCGASNSNSSGLDSQLMQIRTGEGKSMILGAAAVMLALLGFRARCVCYSEYLSARDFNLFRDVFDRFNVTEFVKYSKITTLSEDTTATKGDIRSMTDTMLRGKLGEAVTTARQRNENNVCNNRSNDSVSSVGIEDGLSARNSISIQRNKKSPKRRKKNETSIKRKDEGPDNIRKEILLVDEVDVFFGSDFYGQTYNQVTQFREPEIASILQHIWVTNKRSTRRQRLADIKSLPSYRALVTKMAQFKALIDDEISMMLDQVRKVDEEPYHLDKETDRIGYKVMDSISYEATYGYRTVFAYIQEAERGNLRHEDETLKRALTMPVSCGQFSYAEISPERILGVSGTLSALGDFEYNILSKYGVDKFMYVPSVYGESNFQFDKAGNGICIDISKSDYFHSITNRIKELTKEKRAVIVFFENNARLEEFTKSSFYHKLGRQKKLLTENLSAGEKEFIISKAATAKQITISTAIFGRGTDFFCKDETVQKNGGAHVIQTFLSEQQSEEIQIQGRTARQGKKGSYEMILLTSDLEEKFGLSENMKDNVAKERWYQSLSSARDKFRDKCHATIEENLVDATEKDKTTHLYFDSLLSRKETEATKRFNDMYKSFKKGQMPSSMDLDIALLVDLTGSMAPYAPSVVKTANTMLVGSGSISEKLKSSFPEIDFTLRIGVLGYRDIDDGPQFNETTFGGASHFTSDVNVAINHLESITQSPSGGGDLAEDHLGAIDRASKWSADDDWSSPIKFMLLLTDSPTHGMVPEGSKGVTNVDNYAVRHPSGITGNSVIESLLKNEIDLFFCSFNPSATSSTEQTLSTLYMNHPDNAEQREVVSIPMVQSHNELVPAHSSGKAEVLGGHGQHIVFVLDMSGSMSHDWSGVVTAYNQYIQRRRQNQSECDLVSVVQFDSGAQTTVDMLPISQAPNILHFSGGGTCFYPAADHAFNLASKTPSTHKPVVVFMSDGGTWDADAAAGKFSQLNRNIRQSHDHDLELHVIAFGGGASTTQLQQITGSSRNGKLHTSADTTALSNIFVEIAGGANVAEKLEAEIGKRISDAVSDRLSVEYLG